MKGVFYVFCFVFSVASTAQELQRSSLGMSGATSAIELDGKTYYVLSSVGQQSVIGLASNDTFTLRQGYQQPPIRVLGSAQSTTTLQAAVYPNPVGSFVTINFGSNISSDIQCVLYDIQGRDIVSKIVPPTQSFDLDLSRLAAGTYVLKVQVKGELFTTRLIKN